jgi:hypothetical protein
LTDLSHSATPDCPDQGQTFTPVSTPVTGACPESFRHFQILCDQPQRGKHADVIDQNSLAVALDLGGDPVMTLFIEFNPFG